MSASEKSSPATPLPIAMGRGILSEEVARPATPPAAPPASEASDSEPTLELVGRVASPKVSVVIPALNEAENLRHVLVKLPANIYEVVLVDGGSRDDTVAVTKMLAPNTKVVPQTGRGKGNALIAGFAACSGDIIVMLDADGSADPGEIDSFVEVLLNGADFAKGTRFAHGGGSDDITRLRSAGNTGLVALVNFLFRTHWTDLCYGLNAFWSRCLPHMDVDCDGFEVEALINIRLAKSPLKITEVGSFEYRRIHGNSKLHTFRDGFRVLRVIFLERLSGPRVAASAPQQGEELVDTSTAPV